MDFRKRLRDDQARADIAIAVAAGACGARVEQVASGGRDIRTAFARQVAMYLASASTMRPAKTVVLLHTFDDMNLLLCWD